MELFWILVFMVALLLLKGFFSGSEIALVNRGQDQAERAGEPGPSGCEPRAAAVPPSGGAAGNDPRRNQHLHGDTHHRGGRCS